MQKVRKIAYHTLGCKLNLAETSAIGSQLAAEGYQKVEFSDTPDVFLINTCSVTENADRECRSIVSRALQINPEAIVAITGCYAQLKPEEISHIPGVDLVLGANEKFNAAAWLNTILSKGEPLVKACEISESNQFNSSRTVGNRTRVFLKVQDGCDYNCSFCTIPLARGASRSNTIENVIAEANQIVDSGAKEIVLTGINLGDFGIYDATTGEHQANFYELASSLDQIAGLNRIRISSIEPNLLNKEIIELVASSSRFVPHFHIPLQSGSDTILKKMRRRYLTALYRERIQNIKALMPDCCIGVDVIVGFPGETDSDFNETYNFLNELEISYLHVFTYSERENTLAADMIDAVPMHIRKERNKKLRILSAKKQRKFNESQLGSYQSVLFESDNKDGWMHGFTRNYVKVRTPYNAELINQVFECKLDALTSEGEVDITILSHELA
ncbi:MAG TPA: tRNA (N(6)-L-threonylcarbamoyladenosine(37)-C(2))-methylthiotransferase MtaB [Bacteroidia bacterium]|nr:tRNA (N(6)-L-threonylcarbamoyladenosine(37)-C(2))-methylthiotransferase MtaB [Bacteroidia bacterium]